MAAASQTIHYKGIILKNGKGAALAEIDTTTDGNNLFQKVTKDSAGDRMSVKAPYRDRAPGNGHSVYVRIDWAKNGSYCYLSGIGLGISSNGGTVSVNKSCSSGWKGYGQSKSQHIQSAAWWFFTAGKKFDLRSDSIRAEVRVCEDHSFASDPCSGTRLGGISY